ncbi:MAG: hypothetical protein ACRENK_13380 [Gemmatimonadaceae bacterium]
MFIELLDLLRCIRPHEDTWLVASFHTVSNRLVKDGKLGCPICKAEYPIERGVADFSAGMSLPDCEEGRAEASHRREELATRAGAYLNATEPAATILLGGLWAYAAHDLARMSQVRVFALNAPRELEESETVALMNVGAEIPLAAGSVAGVALDAWFPAAIIESALRVLRPGGRLVGPTNIDTPSELTVLARDENYWVAEKAPEVIPIRRASR